MSFMSSLLRHHLWLAVTVLLCLLQLACLQFFTPQKHQFDWLDIASESLLVLFVLFCFLLVLASRPKGVVTNWFAGGLNALLVAFCHDVFDEIYHIPDQPLLELLEFFPVGLAMLTVALLLWRREQMLLNRHMRRRERLVRAAHLLDLTTGTADLAYLQKYIDRMGMAKEGHSLVYFDIQGFGQINQQYGFNFGDQVLHSVSEIMLMNLRASDLLCRCGGDRFVAVLVDTQPHQALEIAQQMSTALAAMRFYHDSVQPCSVRLSFNAQAMTGQTLDEQIEQLRQTVKEGTFCWI